MNKGVNITEKTSHQNQTSAKDSKEVMFEFEIIGMDCTACAQSIKTYLQKMKGVNNVNINFASETGDVKYNPDLISSDLIKKTINNLGYEVSAEDDEYESEQLRKEKLKEQRSKIIVSIILSGIIAVLSMKDNFYFLSLITLSRAATLSILFILTSIVIFWCGDKFLRGALTALRNRTFDMNTLISMGSLSSYIYSLIIAANLIFHLNLKALANNKDVFFETASMIITFILIGNYLEAVLKTKTQTSVKKLKDLQSKVVNVIRDGNEIFVPFKRVRLNDIVLVKTGDRIPVDGVIIEGFGVVDESAMTGEGLPVEKKVNDRLISGTILRNGFVKLKAEKIGNDTMLSKIITLVKDASNKKPKIQKLADKISGVFVPIVIGIALLTFIFWYFIAGAGLEHALLFSVSVLIIACPCALGLASPIAIIIGVGRAAENGILFNNIDAIENLVKINTVCFDKTGTLTTGEMKVKKIHSLNNYSKNDLMEFAYSVERYSTHPIAKSIVNYGKDHNFLFEKNVKDFKNSSGFGVSALVDNKNILIGNVNFLLENKIPLINTGLRPGNGDLFVCIDNQVEGVIELEDSIKEEAVYVVKKLKEQNYKIFMISGDNENSARRTAKLLNIKDFSYRTLPDEKEQLISRLQSENKIVAMVGDGINDSPSLAKANVGIAIGTGQDIAIDSADVILVKDDLRSILKSITISRMTVSIIKENFFWAFFYNVVAIPFAAGVFAPLGIIISPVMAAMFMALSDVVTVIGNSLRLKYMKIN